MMVYVYKHYLGCLLRMLVNVSKPYILGMGCLLRMLMNVSKPSPLGRVCILFMMIDELVSENVLDY